MGRPGPQAAGGGGTQVTHRQDCPNVWGKEQMLRSHLPPSWGRPTGQNARSVSWRGGRSSESAGRPRAPQVSKGLGSEPTYWVPEPMPRGRHVPPSLASHRRAVAEAAVGGGQRLPWGVLKSPQQLGHLKQAWKCDLTQQGQVGRALSRGRPSAQQLHLPHVISQQPPGRGSGAENARPHRHSGGDPRASLLCPSPTAPDVP